MGFKDYAERHKHDVIVSTKCQLNGDQIKIDYKSYPVEGAHASFESGSAVASRMTATRVATGAVLLGPVGALIGGMAKKDMSKMFVVVELADGTIVTHDAAAKHESKVRKFVAAVNLLSGRSTQSVSPSPVPASAPTPPPPPPPSVPAGWYPDPHGAQLQRYWDGSAWTEHTAPKL